MKVYALFALLFFQSFLFSQSVKPIQHLRAFDEQSDDNFGFSLFTSGEVMATGSGMKSLVTEKSTLKSSGAVYIYHKINNTWKFRQKIIPPNPQPFDFFGEDVLLKGNLLIVGAKGYDGGNFPKKHSVRNGAVFIYRNDGAGNWKLFEKIYSPAKHEKEAFGASIEMWDNYLFVKGSGIMHGNQKKLMGRVYVYQLNDNDSAKLIQTFSPNYSQNSYGFGHTIASSDSILAVSNGENIKFLDHRGFPVGAVYLYKLNASGKWNIFQKIIPADSLIRYEFGRSIFISGNLLTIAGLANLPDKFDDVKGVVDVYQLSDDSMYSFVQTLYPKDTTLSTWFGNSLWQEGDLLAVGAMGKDFFSKGEKVNNNITSNEPKFIGSVYLFKLNGNGFQLKQKYVAPIRQEWSKFGFRTAINANQLIISSRMENTTTTNDEELPNAGSVFIYPIE